MKKWIFFLVVGLVMLFYSTGVAGGDNEVRCDGELMLPGDVCEYTNRSGDVTSRETYDEVREGNERAHHTFVTWGRWALLGGGLALSALGIGGIVRHRRKKAAGPSTADMYVQQQAARSATAPGPHQQAGPAYAPPQQFPPRGYPPQQQPPAAPPGGTDFGPGSGDDVTQRLR